MASLGLLDSGRVLENKQIIKSLRKITRRPSIFRKLCYSEKGFARPNKNLLYIYTINTNCLSIGDPFLPHKKDSQGVISNI